MLIDAVQNVLGEHYNVSEMFRSLLMEGNLGLKEELSVYVTALQSVKSKVKKESNEWKSICFSLVEPIWTLFLFNIQQIEPLVIYKSLLESQKPRILNALSRLQEPVKKILQVEHRRMREDMSWGAGAEELLSATIQHIEDTCDLNNIIRYLVEIIPLIGKVALALDSPKMSPSPGACTSSGLSNQMQSLQGDDKPSLVLGLLSPRRAGGKPGLMPCLLSPKRSNRKCDGIPDLPLDGRESLLISPRLNASNAAHASIRGKREKSLKQPSFFSNNNSVDDNDNREHLSSSLQLTSGL